MATRKRLLLQNMPRAACFGIVGLLIGAQAAFSYHLFYVQSGGAYVPMKWTATPNFTVGSSTGATDITAEVAGAAASWKNITTARSPLGTFTAVPAGTKYNGANFGTAWGILTGDGKQEVIFDQDGSAFAALGLDPASVNGYGPHHATLSAGAAVIDDAFLLLNGTRTDFDRLSTETHELGHIQGLAHSSVGMYNSASIGGEFGAMSPGGDVLDPINVLSVPTMHPFSVNTGTSRRSPKADDAAALSELYPSATFATTLGSISGTVTRCSDGTAVTGVSVRIVNTTNTNIQLSRFTGYDGNTTGSYVINGVPPGTYRVLIEGLGANGFTVNRFTTNVPVKAENDFPSQYYATTCGADINGTPPGTPADTSVATPVTATAGGNASGRNFKVGGVDLAFVVDNTGSMTNEIGAVRQALAQFISDTQAATTAAGKPFPTVAIVPFVDTPSVQVISNNPAKLQSVVAAQFASGGGDCPEPSNNAVLTAGRLLKKKGVAMLFTDADSDANGPSQATVDAYYRSKELRLSVLLSGSCTVTLGSTSSAAGLGAIGPSTNRDEFQPDPPLGLVSSVATFADETINSGGIFTVNTDIKSGISTGYTNTAANIADSSVIPAVGLVSPGVGYRGATMTVTITGSNTNFSSLSTVAFSGGGITVNSTSTTNATSIKANIAIDPAATLSFRDVTVTTNFGGGAAEIAKGTGSFQIQAAPSTATLTAATPGMAGQGQTLNIQISAISSHFVGGTSHASFGTGVTVNSLLVTNSTTATANVTIDPAAGIGFRHASVTTGAETANDTGNGAFFVSPPAPLIPIITSVTPNSGSQAQLGINLTITGQNTHFVSGTSVLSFSNTGITVASLTVNSPTSASATINISGAATLGFSDVLMTTGGEAAALLSGFQVLPSKLQFVPITPCRIADTRGFGFTGPNGPPTLAAATTRSIPVSNTYCNIPSTAAAYALNMTIVPKSVLAYLSVWPTGGPQPLVSTLNSVDGSVLANAAIVPAGTNGQISVFVTNDTDLVMDISGYFVPPTASSLMFVPLRPCRILDTRNPAGAFGGPFLTGGTPRSFPVLSSPCGVSASAQAYSLNVTVVPHGGLNYLTAWPTGQPQPFVSTLNSYDGTVLANAAIIPAGTNGAVSFFAANDTDLVVDINGYFAPAGTTGGLSFYTAPPCRLLDTRNTNGPLGGPIMSGNTSRTFPLATSLCGLPASAGAYSLNMTVVPTGFLGYLSVWPTGQAQPLVSTLNDYKGLALANAALVPVGTNGSVDVYVLNTTHVVIDTNGYFGN